jgi:hypothetical protein
MGPVPPQGPGDGTVDPGGGWGAGGLVVEAEVVSETGVTRVVRTAVGGDDDEHAVTRTVARMTRRNGMGLDDSSSGDPRTTAEPLQRSWRWDRSK